MQILVKKYSDFEKRNWGTQRWVEYLELRGITIDEQIYKNPLFEEENNGICPNYELVLGQNFPKKHKTIPGIISFKEVLEFDFISLGTESFWVLDNLLQEVESKDLPWRIVFPLENSCCLDFNKDSGHFIIKKMDQFSSTKITHDTGIVMKK